MQYGLLRNSLWRGIDQSINCYSWSFKPQVPAIRKRQSDYRLSGKSVHAIWPMWGKSWTSGGDSSPSSVWSRGRQFSQKSKTSWRMNLINSLKLRKAWRIDGIPNECLRHLPRRRLVHLTHLFITAFGCHIFNHLGRKPYRSQTRTHTSLITYDQYPKNSPKAWDLRTARLRYSWMSKKPLALHVTLIACYINCPNCTFRPG